MAYVKNPVYSKARGGYWFFYAPRTGDEERGTIPTDRRVTGLAVNAGQECFN